MDAFNFGIYVDEERLGSYAESAARLLTVTGESTGREALGALRRSCRTIRRAHDTAARHCGGVDAAPAACEWLLDNSYLVKRESLSAASGLRAAGALRCCREGLLVLELCRSLLLSGKGKLTEERCAIYLRHFQKITVLRRAELELIPAALRCVIVDSIAEISRSLESASDTAPHAEALAALFGSLRLLSVLDAEKLLNAADVCSAILSDDPSGDYPRLDADTKREYLRRLSELARRRRLAEHELAKKLIALAEKEKRHVGFYLYAPPRELGGRAYIAANVLLTMFLTLYVSFRFHSFAAALGLLLPVSELVKGVIDYILLRLVRPVPLPRIDTSQGVPEDGRSICVISTLLDAADADRLEELRLACRSEGRHLLFGLLADLPAAAAETADGDEEWLQRARQGVNALNRKYGGGFYLFTRPRVFDGEGYTAHERKRGAVLELARLLCDQESELRVCGDKDALRGVKYIITLDSDTRVYPGAVGQLIGAAIHPLCKPVIDRRLKRVVAGHAILHPRIETELMSATATDFALIFAPAGGSDPYGGICGELYMDAFDNGGFAGKGIIDAAALLECTGDRFPDGRILSHDALEGIYLRGGYMGDTAFSDEFPTKPLAFYKRLHRWTRGDWQNSPWIFRRECSDVDSFRLLDSLRRSLLAPATFVAITVGFILPVVGLRVAAWASLLSLLSGLLIALAEGVRSRAGRPTLRRHTRLLSGFGGAIVRVFLRLWLLPFEAWVCASAILTALWRMCVSHKRLLQWQTAAQGERGGHDFAAHIRAMWFPILTGVLLMSFAPTVIGKAAGFLWLLSPAAAAALALPAYAEKELSAEDRDYLVCAAEGSWRYLEQFSTAENHFLPPDNFQEQPPIGEAQRTSPTNIGLALASAVAAADMELIPRSRAVSYIAHALDTLERLPKYRGHCLNWYDTHTLAPLRPAFVSTVDSGNLCAGLIAVSAALREWGENALGCRAEALVQATDFSFLYDKVRGLFHICYDAEKECGAGGWYDLMASEAMLTSYLAIARGDVPVRHWRRLSRVQLQKDGYRGMASWSGTMFEYLMPELFLPVYRSSLLYESLRFCVYAQKKDRCPGRPWGSSESAFYSLDPSLAYRYKAHGCASLALKRGQEQDTVIAPYASFLALCVDPHGAVQNLRRLERLGAIGRYGFIEALDFTPGRCRSGNGERVQCTMAHHAGMSVIAAANAVCSGSMQRRFMSSPAMRAYSLLLQEKLPSDAPVLRREIGAASEKPERELTELWTMRGAAEDDRLRACLLSNGAYNIMSTNYGHSSASFGPYCVYHGTPEESGLRLLVNGEPISPAAKLLSWELSEEQCRLHTLADGVECTVSTSTAAGDCAELRRIELRSKGSRRVELTLELAPILAEYDDYVNHAAYWRLGMETELAGDALLVHRHRRGEHSGLWLCLRASRPMRHEHRDGDSVSELRVSWPISLHGGESVCVNIALCVSKRRPDALEGAERSLCSEGLSPGTMVGAASVHLGMDQNDIAGAMELLVPLWQNALRDAVPRAALWPHGVSGDLPILCCDARAREADRLLRRFCMLKSCGMNAELVYFSDELGEYEQPTLAGFSRTLGSVGLESLLGARGGIFLVPNTAARLIRSRAAVVIGETRKQARPLRFPPLSAERGSGRGPDYTRRGAAFEFYVNRSLPPVAWQHILTNGSFGYVATDCGTGFLWQKNAREMRITLPPVDVRAVRGSECLYAELGGEAVSLFAANDDHICRVSFEPGCAVWEKNIDGRVIRTTAFIPVGIDARVFLIEGAEALRLHWGLIPVMGAPDSAGVSIRTERDEVLVTNAESYIEGAELSLSASAPFSAETDYIPAAVRLRLVCPEELVLVCGCCSDSERKMLCKSDNVRTLLTMTRERWADTLGRFRLTTGHAALDAYVSTWAPYQCIAGRLLARTSLYQSGGAFGFRDQLQDAVNMLLLSPDYARERILDGCRHQYVEGDVLHWWHVHPAGDRGVRTRCSDDLLWLVWALCEYCEATGDYALCDRRERYLCSEPLRADEHDRYETPERSTVSVSVLDHAAAALACCVARGFGAHGLPYFGSGDWNDAMDAVGGESVWLGWFLCHCADRFAALLDALGRSGAEEYRALADKVGAAADHARTDGWYLRGYFADGTPMNEERIDSITQSWAVLSGHASADFADRALDSALERLVDREHRIVKLFDPPYTEAERSVGSISGYGRGWRENGGQYTHGAIWLAIALLRRGRIDEGFELLEMLLPENHPQDRYRAEPFVLPADVSAAEGHEGEAGWTWYTGSAGWYFRAVTQELFGLRRGSTAKPEDVALPSAIKNARVSYRDADGKDVEIEYG